MKKKLTPKKPAYKIKIERGHYEKGRWACPFRGCLKRFESYWNLCHHQEESGHEEYQGKI